MIDAHQHIWQIGRNGCRWPTAADGVLHRDFGLGDFRRKSAPLGVRATVLVQSQEDERDTSWLLALAEQDPIVAGVVGWTDLAAADAGRRVATLALRPKLKGLRPMVQDRAADWFDDQSVQAGLTALTDQGLRLDALVRVPHLPALGRAAARFPDLPIVVDHAAKPRIAEPDGYRSWYEAIAPLAALPNVWCKLSGLLTECEGCPTDAIARYVEAILALFGPERVMWGSDWPVLEAVSTYAEWLVLARRLVPEAAHAAVFEQSAAQFYGLEH